MAKLPHSGGRVVSAWAEAEEFKRSEHVKAKPVPALAKLPRQSGRLQVEGLLIACGLGLEITRLPFAHCSTYRIVTRHGGLVRTCRSLAGVREWVSRNDFEV